MKRCDERLCVCVCVNCEAESSVIVVAQLSVFRADRKIVNLLCSGISAARKNEPFFLD